MSYRGAKSVIGGVKFFFVILVVMGYDGSVKASGKMFLKICVGVYGGMAWVMGH